MKMKKIQTKKIITKPDWAEDDLSNVANNDIVPLKKKEKVKKVKKIKNASEKTGKVAKTEKVKKKTKKQSSDDDGSDGEEYGASLDKLKEIDPEFYKVKNGHDLNNCNEHTEKYIKQSFPIFFL